MLKSLRTIFTPKNVSNKTSIESPLSKKELQTLEDMELIEKRLAYLTKYTNKQTTRHRRHFHYPRPRLDSSDSKAPKRPYVETERDKRFEYHIDIQIKALESIQVCELELEINIASYNQLKDNGTPELWVETDLSKYNDSGLQTIRQACKCLPVNLTDFVLFTVYDPDKQK